MVDEDSIVRMIVLDVLEQLGFGAFEAGDGGAGLQILQSDVLIDLAISDIGLPGGLNGRQNRGGTAGPARPPGADITGWPRTPCSSADR